MTNKYYFFIFVVFCCIIPPAAGNCGQEIPVSEDRDPFVSIIDLEARKVKLDVSAIKLMGIIWDEKCPVAIINDTLVLIGDEYEGFKVEAIDKDKVTLGNYSRRYKISIDTEEGPSLSKQKVEDNKREKILPRQITDKIPKSVTNQEKALFKENGMGIREN